MQLVPPQIELAPGKVLCIHIPHGARHPDRNLEQEILQLAKNQKKSVALCRPAEVRQGFLERLLKQSSAAWLAHAAGVSKAEARRIIAGLGEPVASKLAYNAGTPRCLLGIAAEWVRTPEVMIYSTAGLDLNWRRAVHRFVASRCKASCVIHLSYPSVYGDGSPHPRECPAGAVHHAIIL